MKIVDERAPEVGVAPACRAVYASSREKPLASSRNVTTTPGRLRFYNVPEHVLAGDVIGGVGFVLTGWHGGMDFIDRLPNIEPDLLHETEIMARQIDADRHRRAGDDD